MRGHTLELRDAALFYGLAFGLALALVLMVPLSETGTYMLTPAIAAVVALIASGRALKLSAWADLGLHRLGLRLWPLAVGVPLIVVGAGYGLIWLAGGAEIAVPATAFGMPASDLIWALPLAFAMNAVTYSLAEEIGWRGFLQPRLAFLGALPATIVVGVLWALWHLPLMLLTGLYHPGENLIVFLPMFVASATAASVFIGWLRVRSESVWPASLAHSAHNIAAAIGMMLLAETPGATGPIAGEAGLATIAGYALVGALLFGWGRRHAGALVPAR